LDIMQRIILEDAVAYNYTYQGKQYFVMLLSGGEQIGILIEL